MSKPNLPTSWTSILRNIERRLSVLENRNRLTSASIKNGTLTVFDPAGNSILFAGLIPTTGDTGLLLNRQDGTLAFTLWNNGGPTQYIAVWDRAGNIIFSEDTTAGAGHARPWLPIFAYPDENSAWAAGGFGNTYRAGVPTTDQDVWALPTWKQQPKVQVTLRAYCDSGTTAVATLYDETHNVPLGTGNFDGTGIWEFQIGPVAMSGVYGSLLQLRVRARRTGGTGNVYVKVTHAETVQS